MTGEECVTYQKQVFKAIKANSTMASTMTPTKRCQN